jgi:hypothetical protein
MLAIDVAARQVVSRWSTRCGGSHGIPPVDGARGMVFAGCSSSGGGAVLDTMSGNVLSGYQVGGGDAILAYSPSMRRFYLRGDPGGSVAILAVCDDGQMSALATVTASQSGHGAAADDRGAVWIADTPGGGLIRIADPYPATP